MTEKNNKMLILFLVTFKQELLAMADSLGVRVVERKKLDDIFAFRIASDEEKTVIHEMVNDVVATNGAELITGQDSLTQAQDVNQVSSETDGSELGKSKTYTSSHFRSDKEAA